MVKIFESVPTQRDWIVEEIMTSLLKLPDINRRAGQFKFVHMLPKSLLAQADYVSDFVMVKRSTPSLRCCSN